MAPLEDLQSRDLAWISDFVMQQVVLMMRPMMEHLQQTDSTVDFTQRQVQRLSLDLSELRADLDRSNKYLAVLRQGVGVQNEGKCGPWIPTLTSFPSWGGCAGIMQRSLESNTRTVKRLDEQVEGLLAVLRGVEENCGQLGAELRSTHSRQEELSQKVCKQGVTLEDLQAKLDRIDSPKEEVLNHEVWQQFRELSSRRTRLVPKLEEKSKAAQSRAEPWPKSYAVEVAGASGGTYAAGSLSDAHGSQVKRVSLAKEGGRVSSSSRPLSQDPFSLAPANPTVWGENEAPEDSKDEAENARLPVLRSLRPVDRNGAEVPRLRFTATMGREPRGTSK
ncbi:unnamed protein product [Effrenium voratum]|nr:unnamed protein product [Effrenium voratum]